MIQGDDLIILFGVHNEWSLILKDIVITWYIYLGDINLKCAHLTYQYRIGTSQSTAISLNNKNVNDYMHFEMHLFRKTIRSLSLMFEKV